MFAAVAILVAQLGSPAYMETDYGVCSGHVVGLGLVKFEDLSCLPDETAAPRWYEGLDMWVGDEAEEPEGKAVYKGRDIWAYEAAQ